MTDVSSFFEGEGNPVDELELSVRARTCLRNDDIRTIQQLKRISDAELLRAPNVGRKTLMELRAAVAFWETQERPAPIVSVPPVFPQPDAHLQLLKNIEQHLANISGLLMRGKSDQLLLQLSVMVQYLFEQETGMSPVRLFEGAKPLNVR